MTKLAVPPIKKANTAVIDEGASLIRQGEIVAFPTETLYGLGCDATSIDAISRLLSIKGRAAAANISVLVSDEEMLMQLVADIPPLAQQWIQQYWPGPLTMILPARPNLPSVLVNERGGIGVRISPDKIATQLVRQAKTPLTATSANLSGQPPATTAQQAALLDVALVIDDGERNFPASTVVEILDKAPRILREGAIKLPRK